MNLLPVIAFAGMAQLPEPVLWLRTDGRVTVEGAVVKPTFSPGTTVIKTRDGAAYDFSGGRSGILLGDIPALRLTESFTVSVWLNLRQYVIDGPGAQILFRGDDRSGHDPYTLVVHPDGTVNFGVQNDEDRGTHTSTEIPLNSWHHVLGNFDAKTGKIQLFFDGSLVAFTTTSVRPFADLDQGQAPGVSIGNVQNEKGIHNQPFNGRIADLRVYRGLFTPADLGLGGQVDPPK